MDVNGKIAIITGAASGIGEALAYQLAKKGCTVALGDIQGRKLRQVLKEVKKYSPKSMCKLCDCTRDKQVKEMVGAVYEKYERIDIMLNIAGIASPGLVKDLTVEDYYKDINIGFFGAVRFNHEVLPIMLQQHSGMILNMSSGANQVHLPFMSAYCTTKSAIYTYSDCLYNEVRSEGIHVGVIQPMWVRTEMTGVTEAKKSYAEVLTEFAQGSTKNYRDFLQYSTPMQDPEDTAREIIAEGIEKEHFEIYAGAAQAESAVGIVNRMLPGLGRGVFSLLTPLLSAVASELPEAPEAIQSAAGEVMKVAMADPREFMLTLSKNPELIKSTMAPLIRAGVVDPESVAFSIKVMNALYALLDPASAAFKEVFVTLDENVNRAIYETGQNLMRELGLLE